MAVNEGEISEVLLCSLRALGAHCHGTALLHRILTLSLPGACCVMLLASLLTLLGRKRYLVLNQGCCYYFDKETATQAKGCFSLRGYRCVCVCYEVCVGQARLLCSFNPLGPTYNFSHVRHVPT